MFMYRVLNKSFYKKPLRYCNFSDFKPKDLQKPILYGDDVSPPVRFAMMTAFILDIDFKFIKVDLFKNENRSDFYRKINPLQKVPAMVVGDAKICDSHAIALYLCQTAKNQSIYPDNPILRAKVNQLLFFNSSTLFRIDSEILSNYFAKQWPVNKSRIEEWYSALDYLESHLRNGDWLMGNKMLLCDVCMVAVVTSILKLLPLTKRHENVQKWIKRFEGLSFYRINERGLTNLHSYIDLFKN